MAAEVQARGLSGHARLAIAVALVFVPGRALHGHLAGHLGPHEDFLAMVLFQLMWCALWIVGAILVLFWLARKSNDPIHRRVLPAVALVASFIAAIGIDSLRYDHLLGAYARQKQAELAGPGPTAVSYWEGIPDGGTAIVRWQSDPERLPQSTQVDLTGERLRGCRQFEPGLWVCRYD